MTNLDDVHSAIPSYQKRFSIEEMFRDFKSERYNLEGSRLAPEYLSTLLIVITIAYTSAMLHGRAMKKKETQKYITRPETRSNKGRRHSAFHIGQHHYT